MPRERGDTPSTFAGPVVAARKQTPTKPDENDYREDIRPVSNDGQLSRRAASALFGVTPAAQALFRVRHLIGDAAHCDRAGENDPLRLRRDGGRRTLEGRVVIDPYADDPKPAST